MRGLFFGLSTTALLLSPSSALHFTPDSECAALCSSGSNSTASSFKTSATNSSEIVCEDGEYSDSGNGIRFKNCLNCLQKSDATWEEESDVYWFLYNVRYAFDVCLYSYPDAVDSGTINSPCNIESSCGSLEDALTLSLKTDTDNQFDYCEANDSIIKSSSYKECLGCLQSTSNQKYLANFLVALKAGCIQEPEKGDIIGLSGTIFSTSLINITDPNTNKTLPGDDGAPVGSMTTGTIVGIAVGCGLAFAGAVWLLFIYCRRSRKRQGAGIKIESPPPDAPMNDRSMYGIQKSSYFTDHPGRPPSTMSNAARFGAHSRNASNVEYFDGLDNGRGSSETPVTYHYAPHAKSNAPNGALPTHPAYIPRVVSRLPDPRLPAPSGLRNVKTNVPDSYALQTYLNATGSEARRTTDTPSESVTTSHAGSRNPSPVPQQYAPANPTASVPPPPPGPPPSSEPQKPKLPSFAFPSLTKLSIPKKKTPPQLNLLEATPISAVDNDPGHELRISKPLAVLDPRFQDKPLGGGQVLSYEIPAGFNDEYLKRREANISPMLSGNSRVYG
ncbi:hypothetical protein NW752_004992 [Fusarium irregulare]|uniref:Exo-alpha-sialidase / neuraminidase n=1 Tax=Fusarium irregulare TaxID=2494466 RepID=A0A9W8PKZ7_9HYPO|nr:hypothetical protein NW766_008187 [Fusarium irregulare]KAJ4019891.1 hypothetical protein NW752_004992 [Fusarium irregulare]